MINSATCVEPSQPHRGIWATTLITGTHCRQRSHPRVGVYIPTYLEPSDVEEELEKCENRDVQVDLMVFVALHRVKELSSDQAKSKEGVYCNRHDLCREQP